MTVHEAGVNLLELIVPVAFAVDDVAFSTTPRVLLPPHLPNLTPHADERLPQGGAALSWVGHRTTTVMSRLVTHGSCYGHYRRLNGIATAPVG